MMKKALVLLVVFAVALVALNAVPKKRVIVPPWWVEVVDETGSSAAGVLVYDAVFGLLIANYGRTLYLDALLVVGG